jgi:tetratricopeptide (TPR) repeat protein
MRCWMAFVLAMACSKSDPPAPAAVTAKPEPSLGALTFALTEGNAEARADFTRGLLALHSFWYDEATRQFDAAIAADPAMRMAYWGAMMSHLEILWGDDDLAAAKQAIRRMPDPEGLPPREQAWVEASLELIAGGEIRTTRKKFADAMEQVNKDYPDDESATFLSIALLASNPEDTATRLRAAELALAVYEHNPKHPGAAHYAIHALDTPELAARALPIAKAYAQIAPAAFHARHMPAHIFSRLGMWPEALASCRAAWDVSKHRDFHSLNWIIEMSFELGQRTQADAALAAYADAVRAGLDHTTRGQYAIQIASYMMRTGEWSRVEELLQPLASAAKDEGAAMMGCGMPTHSPGALLEQVSTIDARAWAAAMQHDVAATKLRLAELDAVHDQLRPVLAATQPPAAVAAIEVANKDHREALLARAANDDRALVKLLAGKPEPKDSGESQLGAFIGHEELADGLMRLHQPKQAAAEYKLVLASHPNRAHSLLGAARAATQSGDPQAARSRYSDLLVLWANADANTDGLVEAQQATK